MTKEIYRAWQVKSFGKTNYGRSVEYKHAIVDYFRENAKILIVTDAGSEGLNLQFCNTVINYDLPWNPQKIEQRIGRCHRYGQKNDVIAINLLNTENAADRRVYDILSKKFELFEGVFGASDVALGILESGISFERMILEIYQNCNSSKEFQRAFDKLEKRLDAKRDKKASQLRTLLLTESREAKGAALEKTKHDIDQYLQDVEFWTNVEAPDNDLSTQFWRIDHWGEECFGEHGTMFIGSFCDQAKQLFPVTLLCDENDNYIDFTEADLVGAMKLAEDSDIHYFVPTKEENERFGRIYDRLIAEMGERYETSVRPVQEYNKQKLENWAEIRTEQLTIEIAETAEEMRVLNEQATAAKDFLEKVDIRKEADKKKKQLEKLEQDFHTKATAIQEEATRDIAAFNESMRIRPVLVVNTVLKF